MFDEHVGQVLFALLEVERQAGVVVAGEEAHAGGFDGGDDELCLIGRDLPEGGSAGFEDLGVWREVFEGEDVVRGEAEDGLGREGSSEVAGGEDGGVEGLSGFVVRDEDEAGRGGGADEEREIQRAGGKGEAGDTSSPAAGAEMLPDTVEWGGVLKVREKLANEGENHAGSILVDMGWP